MPKSPFFSSISHIQWHKGIIVKGETGYRGFLSKIITVVFRIQNPWFKQNLYINRYII